MKKGKYEAFTLIEILLVVALMSIVALITVSLDNNFIARNQNSLAFESAQQSIRRARLLSVTSYYDDAWSVRFIPGKIILYKGSDFSLRDPEYDEEYAISSKATYTGVTDVTFSEGGGIPSVNGSLTISSVGSTPYTLVINEQGFIE